MVIVLVFYRKKKLCIVENVLLENPFANVTDIVQFIILHDQLCSHYYSA